MVNKEISDHVHSWRFIILLGLIALTCIGSVSTGLINIHETAKSADPDNPFLFLLLFTASDGTLPPFFVFISFLGPLLGISMGFDAINSEQVRGTLSRVLSQPVHRDYILNAKFVASLYVVSVMLFSLGFLVMGAGLVMTGIPPTAEEFLRVVSFIIVSILYVAFWLNLSILFSVRFRQPATSALAGISVWLLFTVFYSIIVSLIAKAASPSENATAQQIVGYQETILNLFRVLPSQLYSDATTTLLAPTVRSLGPLTMEQIVGAIPGHLPLAQSLLLVWPQITGLTAATILCFVLSYISFMRREIRSR
ncbi:MAG: ABC transporter permease subunit [Bacteroidota bacterium]|nr:ABC transporter permease subunit [Bacteroidota bacterium]